MERRPAENQVVKLNKIDIDIEKDIAITIPAPSDPFKLQDYLKTQLQIKEYPKDLKAFYTAQNHLIDSLLHPDFNKQEEEIEVIEYKIAMYGSLLANICLFIILFIAAIFSGSLALFATTVDAFMDLASNIVLLYAGFLASKNNYLTHPAGKSRYKTAGIIVFSVLMSTLSIEIFIESIKSFIKGSTGIQIDLITYIILGLAFIFKLILFIYCRRHSRLPSVKILAQDHFNDMVINTLGVSLGILASKTYWFLDPTGALLIALFILKSWSSTAKEHIQLIVGRSASPEFLNKIIYLALTHDDRIVKVDTASAYHSGDNLFVEVDIVLPPCMRLDEAHDVGEELQKKLESIENVDRAFVHLDYETEHHPEHRKKN